MPTRRRAVAGAAAVLAIAVAACGSGDDGTSDATGASLPDTVTAPVDGDASTTDDGAGSGAVDDLGEDADELTGGDPIDEAAEATDPADRVDGGKDVARSVEGVGDPANPVEPDGFTTVTARVTAPDGEECEVCLWLADESAERGRGLMQVTDLGDPVGMAFSWDAPTSGNFYMFNTLMPLSIAWVGTDGVVVATADMEPCTESVGSDCPLYGPGGEAYDLAVEMVQGELDAIGIEVGARVELLAGTESPVCDLLAG